MKERYFTARKNRISKGILLSVLVFAVMIGALGAGVTQVSSMTEEKEMETIENAVVQTAVYCYGTEGAYPESLSYLKENYGLTYNEEKYVVKYEVTAKNLRPNVKVIRISGEASPTESGGSDEGTR